MSAPTFSVVFPPDQSFILITPITKIGLFPPQSPEVSLSFMLSFALVFGHLHPVFGSPIPLFIHPLIPTTKPA